MTEEKIELKLEDIMNWTDEECNKFDEERHVAATAVRDLAKRLTEVIASFNTLREDYKTLYNENAEIKRVLLSGSVLGYTIVCPECKVSYNVKPEELNYDVEITCQDCGAKYIQNQNIVGLYLREDNVDATQE